MPSANQVLPYSAFDSENPEDLWKYLANYEQKTGGQVLAIPHNGNLSNGRMFALADLMVRGGCRPVRQWAARMVWRDLAAVAAVVPLEEMLGWLGHGDAEVVELAAALLRSVPGLADLSADRWMALAESPSPMALELICELMERYLRPEDLSLAQAVRLASSRPLPVARLGLRLLQLRLVLVLLNREEQVTLLDPGAVRKVIFFRDTLRRARPGSPS